MEQKQTTEESILNRSILLKGGPLDGTTVNISTRTFDKGLCHLFAGEDDKRMEVAYYNADNGPWRYLDYSKIPDILPTTGRVVWYQPSINEYKLLSGIHEDIFDGYMPAIVIRGFKDGTAHLKVFGQADIFVSSIPYHADGNAGTWRWPVIEKQPHQKIAEIIGIKL